MSGPRRSVQSTSAATLLLVLTFVLLLSARLLREQPPSPGEVVRQQQAVVIERVIDGDTLVLAGGQRLRLIGVDAPETKHPDLPVDPLGLEASAFVQALIGEQAVRLEFDRERLDRYERLLAYVWLPDGRLLNAELIRAGFSIAQTRYPYRQDMKRRFVEAEADARAAGVGMWRAAAESAQ